MLTFNLSDEQLAIQSMAREFAEGEIRPIAEKLDQTQHLLEDFPWSLVRKGSEIGFRTVALPKEYGGLDLDSQTWVILIDELGYPDITCAKIFSQNWKLCEVIANYGTQEQKDRVLSAFRDDDTFLLGYADMGADYGANSFADEQGYRRLELSVRRVGDHYVLNGEKRFVSLGPVAKLVLVSACTDSNTSSADATSIFLVPTGVSGLSIASPDDRVGLRIDLQGRLVFDNVRIPVGNLLGGEERIPYGAAFEAAVDIENSAYAMTVARAALDAATKYATERIQGGKRIIEHQAVALSLAEMYIGFQAGRSLLWRAAWKVDNNEFDRALTKACKVFCTETAVNICHEALELFGGAGVMRELPMQKYFRDSLALLHMAGANDVNRVQIGEILANRTAGGQLLQ